MIYLINSEARNTGMGVKRLESFLHSLSSNVNVDVVKRACRNRTKERIDFISGSTTQHNVESVRIMAVFLNMLNQISNPTNNILFLSEDEQHRMAGAYKQVGEVLQSKHTLDCHLIEVLSDGKMANHVCMYFSMCIGFMPYDLSSADLNRLGKIVSKI